MSRVPFFLLLASLSIGTPPLSAQEPASRSEEQARQQQEKARAISPYRSSWIERQLLSIEQAGGFGVVRGVFLTFGDIKPGSNLALGPAYGKMFDSGAVVIAKAVYSIRNFKLLQLSAQSPTLAGRRLRVKGRVRWQDAPALDVYALGPDSSSTSGEYGERKQEVSGEALFMPSRFLRVAGGTAFERFHTSSGSGEQSLATLLPGLPGVDADPDYLHAFLSAAADSRDGEGYSRHGSLLRGALHDYRQQGSGPYSFQRIDGAAEQYVPVLHGNWVLYFGLHASTTRTAGGDTVPFFLLPELGGRDLRGYPTYRFRDRHSLNVTAEYRWYAQEFLDAAVFYDAGKTVPTRGDLDFSRLKSDVGIGVRLHSPQSSGIRLEVARGRGGFRFVLGFSPIGG